MNVIFRFILRTAKLILIAVIGFVLIIYLIGRGSNNDEDSSQKSKVVSGCQSDWTKCKDNSDLANNFGGMNKIRSSCESKLAEIVKYGKPKTEGPFIGFQRFHSGDDYISKGVAVLIDKSSVQNQYGTFQNGEEYCEYDLKIGKIIKMWGSFNELGGFWVSSESNQ